MADPERGQPGSWRYFAYWQDGSIALKKTAIEMPASDLMSVLVLRRMTFDAGYRILCGQQTGRWFAWDGTVYAPQDAMYASRLAQWYAGAYDDLLAEVRKQIRAEAEIAHRGDAGAVASEEKAELEHWKKHNSHRDRIWSENGQGALIRQLTRTCGVDEQKLDAEPGEIVVDNGRISYARILRNRRAELLQHDPERLVTRRMGGGVCYDPEAACPVFDRFMETSVADPAQRHWLLWRTVNALFGRMPRKGFVNLIGEHDSGKTTYVDIMAALGGGCVITVPVQTFLVKRNGDSGFREAELRGARMVCATEPKPGGRYDDGYMKEITGRDRQRTAAKWEKPVEWEPQCTPFIGSNHPVRFASSDEAMMSRHEAVRFARGYLEMDTSLHEKLRAELPGILNRLLECAAWEARNGLPALPASMVAERERLATETEDPLAFAAEWAEQGRLAAVPPASVPVSACVPVDWLYQQYRTWCEVTEGIRAPLGRRTFSAIVGRRYPVAKSGTYRFTGLVARTSGVSTG